MRVLHVIDTLEAGGAEKVLVTLTSLLKDAGINVDVLVFEERGSLIQSIHPKVGLQFLGRTNKYALSTLYKAHQICTKYDIVHVHMRHCYTYIRLAQLVFGGKYKIILHDHSGSIELNRSVPFKLKFLLKPRYYIGVSSSLVQWAKSDLNISDTNCFLLANTIIPSGNVHYIYPANNNIMVVSNIKRIKNIEFAIDLAKLSRRNLTVYGNKQDEKYYKEILKLAIENNIKLVEGNTNIGNEYSKYSLALHCSKSETGPLVLLEYLAYGIPFLSYKTGEVANMLSDILPDHFIDTFDKEKWLVKMNAITAKSDISKEFKAVFQQYFSPDKYVQQCIRIYQNVLY